MSIQHHVRITELEARVAALEAALKALQERAEPRQTLKLKDKPRE